MEMAFTWIQQNLVEIMAILTNILLGLEMIFNRKSTKLKGTQQTAEQLKAKRQAKLQKILKKAEALQAEYYRLQQAGTVTVSEVRNLNQMCKELENEEE